MLPWTFSHKLVWICFHCLGFMSKVYGNSVLQFNVSQCLHSTLLPTVSGGSRFSASPLTLGTVHYLFQPSWCMWSKCPCSLICIADDVQHMLVSSLAVYVSLDECCSNLCPFLIGLYIFNPWIASLCVYVQVVVYQVFASKILSSICFCCLDGILIIQMVKSSVCITLSSWFWYCT